MKKRGVTLCGGLRELLHGRGSISGIRNECKERREKWGGITNAFGWLADDEDGGLSADERWRDGEPHGVLDGLPIAVKDNFAVAGMPLTCSSQMLEAHKALYSATVVQRLQGAHVVGKTVMDEFAMGSATTPPHYPTVQSPYTATKDGEEGYLCPGGSSGGSAVAVATGQALAALGSDTGGSVRQPGAFCGIVAFKPTFGALSRFGLVAFASSLDTPGFLTQSVEDAGLLFDLTSGRDEQDATSTPMPFSPPSLEYISQQLLDGAEGGDGGLGNAVRGKEAALDGVVVGIPKEYVVQEMDDAILQAWEQAAMKLESRGATIEQISLPLTRQAIAAYYVIAPAEAASNLARYDGARYGPKQAVVDGESDQVWKRFGEEVRRRILVGNYVLRESAREDYFEAAWNVRRAVRDELSSAMKKCNVLLTPTTPTLPWLQSETPSIDPIQLYLSDVLTAPSSLAGFPAISIPSTPASCDARGRKGTFPIGLQLIAPPYRDGHLLHVAAALENTSS